MKQAFLFPGQGAQNVGMGEELCREVPACKELFDRANEVLGYDLAEICFKGPIETLTRSSNAQPAIFLHGVAAYEALRQRMPDLKIECAAGLSSGEWTALYLAGVLSFEDTLRVLQARGEYMQKASEEHEGGMLSVIGLDLPVLEEICRESGLTMANLNSPAQTVLSGPVSGVAVAEKLALDAGAKRAIPLNVAGAFHSSLMDGAAERLGEFLSGLSFSAPSFTVVANVTGEPHVEPDEVRQRMVEQVTHSVQWVKSIQWMRAQGVQEFVECGPGRVLTGLVKRIDKDTVLHNIQGQSDLEKTLTAWGRN